MTRAGFCVPTVDDEFANPPREWDRGVAFTKLNLGFGFGSTCPGTPKVTDEELSFQCEEGKARQRGSCVRADSSGPW